MYIKKGDNVIVITGAEAGKIGKVSRVFSAESRVVVEGVNVRKKHARARKTGQKGQVINIAMPIHASNVSLVEGGKPVRAKSAYIGGKWVRVSRKSGKEI